MKKSHFLIKVLIVFFFYISIGVAKESSYFIEGKKHFDNKEFDKSKILFERDLVFNPKSEKSYLFLAKIFDNDDNDDNDEEQEHNLKNVLLLNPANDEAIYMLALIKIKQSDYSEAKQLINKFSLVCKSFCSKKKEIENKLDKLIPENAKNND